MNIKIKTRTVEIREKSVGFGGWVVSSSDAEGFSDVPSAFQALENVKAEDAAASERLGCSVVSNITWVPCTKIGRQVVDFLGGRRR